jgi:hypothetical protein
VRPGAALVALATVTLASAGTAMADEAAKTEPAKATEAVAILEVEADGVSEAAAEMFERGIEEGLAGTGFRVVSRDRLAHKLLQSEYVDGCTFGPCLRRIYQASGIRLVLTARVRGIGPSYSFVVSLLDTRSGVPTSQVAERCAVCTVDEAISTATLAVVGLVTGTGGAKVADPETGPVGSRDAVSPAKQLHVVESRAQGRRSTLRRIGYAFAGAAAVAGVAGGVLLANDDTDVGYASVSAGGAFVITGVTLFVLSGTF